MALRDWLRGYLGITDRAPPASERKPMKISEAAITQLAMRPPATVRKLVPYEPPPGVRPSSAKVMAFDDSNTPGAVLNWANAGAGIGCGLYFPGYPYLAELSQRPEYRNPVESIAEEMTRKWITFKSRTQKDSSKRIDAIKDAFETLGVQEMIRHIIEIDGYFGRAQIFIDIKGQREMRNLPLKIDEAGVKKGTLMGLKAVEPIWTTPITWNAQDPAAPDFYRPAAWYMLSSEVHADRLLTLITHPVPDLLKPSYNFGGISLSQMLEPYVTAWLQDKNSVSRLIRNFSMIALMTDLNAILQDGGDATDLTNRLRILASTRDNQNLWALNKDTEELTQTAVPLGTLDALLAQSQEHMCGVTREPLVKAFGITPTGLNASSEGEIAVFYDHIAALQEKLSPILKTITRLVQLNEFGNIDDGIEHEFLPLKELDGEALARVRRSDADAAAVYIQSGVLSPDEERERLQDDPDSPYVNLAGPAPDPPMPDEPGAEGGDDDE